MTLFLQYYLKHLYLQQTLLQRHFQINQLQNLPPLLGGLKHVLM